jgi:hypothetical protein
MSLEDIYENFGENLKESKIWKFWQVPTENGESRTRLGEVQGSLAQLKKYRYNIR